MGGEILSAIVYARTVMVADWFTFGEKYIDLGVTDVLDLVCIGWNKREILGFRKPTER